MLSKNESARAKIFTNMLPGSQMDAMRQLGFPRSMHNGVEKVVSTLLRGRGVNVCAL